MVCLFQFVAWTKQREIRGSLGSGRFRGHARLHLALGLGCYAKRFFREVWAAPGHPGEFFSARRPRVAPPQSRSSPWDLSQPPLETSIFFGFSIFIASDFGGTVALGLLVSVTLLFAMTANLLLLPSLLLSLERMITTRSFREPLIDILDEEEDIELDALKIRKES